MLEICQKPNTGLMLGAPLVGLVVMLAVVMIVQTVVRRRHPISPGRRIMAIVGVLIGAGASGAAMYMTRKNDDRFYSVAIDGAKATLDYAWPYEPTDVDVGRITGVKVVRAQSFYKGSRRDDDVWVRLVLGNDRLYSCHTKRPELADQAAKTLAQAAKQQVDYVYSCPKTNVDAASTKEAVLASGRSSAPAECGAR